MTASSVTSRMPSAPGPDKAGGDTAGGDTAGGDAMGPNVASVPWMTVLTLAVVLSFADGFWATSMRGAVGAAGLGPAPFTMWWRESSVLAPLYACAVLGSLALAARWSRAGRRRARLVAGVLVAALSAVVGVGHLVAGAVQDYGVQWAQLQMKTSMNGDCAPDCLERLRQDTLGLQVRAVTIGALLLLVTNLGSVAWVTMFRGGRLDVVGSRQARTRLGRTRRAPVAADRQLRWFLAIGLVGLAAIHLAVVPEHLEEWPAAGAFFVLLAAAELVTAAWVLRGTGRASLLLAVATSVGPLVVWGWSRATGLPFGPSPQVPEPVGLPDVVAVILEVVALVVAVMLVRQAHTLAGRPRWSDPVSRLGTLAVVAVTVIALAATQEGWFNVLPVMSPHG